MNEAKLSEFQQKLLAYLREHGPKTFIDIRVVMDVPAGALVRSLGVLESCGLIGQSGMPVKYAVIQEVASQHKPLDPQKPVLVPVDKMECKYCGKEFFAGTAMKVHLSMMKGKGRHPGEPDLEDDPPGQIVLPNGAPAGGKGVDREAVRDWLDRLARAATELREILFGSGGGAMK